MVLGLVDVYTLTLRESLLHFGSHSRFGLDLLLLFGSFVLVLEGVLYEVCRHLRHVNFGEDVVGPLIGGVGTRPRKVERFIDGGGTYTIEVHINLDRLERLPLRLVERL